MGRRPHSASRLVLATKGLNGERIMSQPKDLIDQLLSAAGRLRRVRSTRRQYGPARAVPERGRSPSSSDSLFWLGPRLVRFTRCSRRREPLSSASARVIVITDPGLHFKLPFGLDRVQGLVATERVLKQEVGFRTEVSSPSARTRFADRDFPSESLMLTGDLNIIQVEWVVQYRIGDPIRYLYGMRETTRTLRDLSESV